MSKIADAFTNKKAFIAYLMAGDPNLKVSAEYILTAQESGADLIEIGIPFSDPIAEGEIIQNASLRALKAGTRLDGIFDMVESIKGKMRIPMVFMTYLNPVYVYGYDSFFSKCKEIGVCGIIIPDLPFGEQDEAKEVARKYDVEVVTLVALTSQSRITEIVRHADGFLYLVSSLGVTGVRSEISTDISSIVEQIRRAGNIPVAIGFGIAEPSQAARCSSIADGVIVGSAIVSIIADHGEKAKEPLYAYIKSMKEAVGP